MSATAAPALTLSSDTLRCKLSEGVMFLRHAAASASTTASASAAASSAAPTPLLLFCAGFGSASTASASASAGAPPVAASSAARRLYWARMGAESDPARSSEWAIECARLSELQHVWIGGNQAAAAAAVGAKGVAAASAPPPRFGAPTDLDLQSRCFSLVFSAPAAPPLCLEAASAAMRTCFLLQLRSLLKQEKIDGAVTFHEAPAAAAAGQPSLASADTLATQPEPDRPDALHFVLSHLHASATRNFNAAAAATNAKSGGSGAQVSPAGTVQLPPSKVDPRTTQAEAPTILPLSAAVPASAATATTAANPDAPAIPSASDPLASAAPLLLQLTLRCSAAFGLVADTASAAVVPYPSPSAAAAADSGPPQPFLADLALAAFERHPLSGRLSYIDHSEVIPVALEPASSAAAAAANAAAGSTGAAAVASPAFERVFNVLYHAGLKQQLLLSLYDVSLGRTDAEKAAARATAPTVAPFVRPSELHVAERSRIGTAVLLLDEIMKAHPYTAPAAAATAAAKSSSSAIASASSSCLHEISTPLLNYNNAAIAAQLQRLGSRYTISIRACPGKQLPTVVSEQQTKARSVTAPQNGATAPAASFSANGAASSSSSAPASSAGAAAAAAASPRSLAHSNPENLSVKQKLAYFEDVGSEPWYNPLTGARSAVRAAEFVPTKQYWEEMQRNEEEAEAKAAREGAYLYLPKGHASATDETAGAAAAADAAASSAVAAVPAFPAPRRAVLRIHASQLHPALLLNATAAASPPLPPPHCTMLVVFSQESRSGAGFTFIGHSEVVSSREMATARFSTTFNVSYHAAAHRSVLVHLYDGARAAALIEAGKGGGSTAASSGLGSLADDLLASFVLDMDDLAEAAPGSMLVYAPQQITEKHKLRCMKTNPAPDGTLSEHITEPRIMVAFQCAAPQEEKTATAAATKAPSSVNPVDAQARLLDALSSGSLCTLFSAAPTSAVGRGRAPVFDVDDASSPFPAPLVDPESKGMESVRLCIDVPSARLYWCAPAMPAAGDEALRPPALSIKHSVRVSNIVALVVGRHTSSMLQSTHALNAPDSVCWSILASYELAAPIVSAHDGSLVSSVPITLDFACGSQRARSMWVAGLRALVAQCSTGARILPVLESAPDREALETAHSDEFARALGERKKRQAAAAAARAQTAAIFSGTGLEASPRSAADAAAARAAESAAAATAVAAAKAAAARKALEDSEDEEDLSDISTDDDSDDEYIVTNRPKKAKREKQPKKPKAAKPPLVNRAASVKQQQQPSAMALATQAKQHAPVAADKSDTAASDAAAASAAAASSSAFAATLSAVASAATVAPLTLGPLPAAAPAAAPVMLSLNSVSIPRSYYTPLYLSTDLEISLKISCTGLFALDASRAPDLVLAVFQGSTDFDPTRAGDKPATPSQLGFSPAAAFKYALVDNSEAVRGDTEPQFDKSFDFELAAGAPAAQQHLRINLYDAEGEGVTAKDQLGLIWLDLRPVLLAALAQEPGGGSADTISFPSDHQLTVALLHPTNPSLHAKLARCRAAMHLALQIVPKVKAQFIARNMDDDTEAVVPGTFGDLFTPTPEQMSSMNLAPLLGAIKARAKQKDAEVADYGNAIFWPQGTYGWIKVTCHIAHQGELPLPTRVTAASASSSSASAAPPARQLLFALYERTAPSTAPRAINPSIPFLFKSVSAPAMYTATASASGGSGGVSRGTFVTEVHVGDRQILLLAVFFADQLAGLQGSMPDPTRAWGCCLLSAEELAKSSRALKLPLHNPFVPALGRRLADAHAVCQVQLKEIIERDEQGAAKAAAAAAAEQIEMQELDRLNAAKDLMFDGSFMRLHELDAPAASSSASASTGSFVYRRSPIVLFGRLELEEGEAVEEGAWAVLWCARAHDRSLRADGSEGAEDKRVVDGNYMQVAFLKHIYLGRSASPAFTHPQALAAGSSSSLKSDGCFFRLVGHYYPDAESDDYETVDLALEAESTEIRDEWVLGLMATAKEDGNTVQLHGAGQ